MAIKKAINKLCLNRQKKRRFVGAHPLESLAKFLVLIHRLEVWHSCQEIEGANQDIFIALTQCTVKLVTIKEKRSHSERNPNVVVVA